jgi:hypothetical protein
VLVLPTLLQKFLGTFYGLFAKLQTNGKKIYIHFLVIHTKISWNLSKLQE